MEKVHELLLDLQQGLDDDDSYRDNETLIATATSTHTVGPRGEDLDARQRRQALVTEMLKLSSDYQVIRDR